MLPYFSVTPQLSISFGAAIQHDAIREGSNVSLECHVAGNPPIGEVGWLFENTRILVGSSSSAIYHQNGISGSSYSVKENTLMIHSVGRKHAGRYRCVASNAQGEGKSEDILLKVQCEFFLFFNLNFLTFLPFRRARLQGRTTPSLRRR